MTLQSWLWLLGISLHQIYYRISYLLWSSVWCLMIRRLRVDVVIGVWRKWLPCHLYSLQMIFQWCVEASLLRTKYLVSRLMCLYFSEKYFVKIYYICQVHGLIGWKCHYPSHHNIILCCKQAVTMRIHTLLAHSLM